MNAKVNTSMNQVTEKPTIESSDQPAKRPNENGSFAVMGHIKIFDPNTKEVLVESRE